MKQNFTFFTLALSVISCNILAVQTDQQDPSNPNPYSSSTPNFRLQIRQPFQSAPPEKITKFREKDEQEQEIITEEIFIALADEKLELFLQKYLAGLKISNTLKK